MMVRTQKYLLLFSSLAVAALGIWFITSTGSVIVQGAYDFDVYWQAGRTLLNNQDVYDPAFSPPGRLFLYPPAIAATFLPLSLLPQRAATIFWFAYSVACTVVACVITVRLVNMEVIGEDRNDAISLVVMFGLALLFYPNWTNIKLGQINAQIFLLFVGALYLLKKGYPVFGGILLGLSACIKLTPLVFVLFAFWIGHRKFAFASALTFILVQLFAALLLPTLTWGYISYITHAVSETQDSINIALTNLAHFLLPEAPPIFLSLVKVVALSGLLLPFVGCREGNAPSGMPRIDGYAYVLTGLAIFGPLVETHHLVWLILPIWLVARLAMRKSMQKRKLLGLITFAVMFLFLSQPFRISRLIGVQIGLQSMPETLQGGLFLTLGVVIAYIMLSVLLVPTMTPFWRMRSSPKFRMPSQRS